MRFIALFAAGLVLAVAMPAHAQKPEAVAAFSRGKDLLAQGKVAEACGEFELSMRLDPQNGTLYNLALCHEQLGKVASAWSEMKELSETDKNAARAKDAGKRAAALEKKLTRMRIVVTAPVEGLVIKRNNVDVTPLAGKESPVDPATYTFVASAPGYADASLQVDLTAPGQTVDVTIPALTQKQDSKPDPDPAPSLATDSYASRLTLRGLTLNKGVYELGLRGAWVSSGNFEQDPLDVGLSGRAGFGRIEVHAGLLFHARYEQVTTTRPTITRTASFSADYVISPLFNAGIDIRKQHPFGGDLYQGFDFRSDIEGKRIITPSVAFIGAGGILYLSRRNRGQSVDLSEFAFVGDGTVQLSIERFTLSAFARMQVNVSGDIYADTVVLDIGATGTAVLTRNLDAYIQTILAALPRADNNDYRTLTLGVIYRLP